MRGLDDVDLDAYDFLDLGAGTGGSVELCTRLFGGRGLGIDNAPKKVRAAHDAGADVVLGDITALPRRPLVRYVSMCDFLEHLPTYDLAREMLSVAASVATDFLYIRHPSFEDEAYLRALGLKQYWQDWTGHPSHLLLSDLTEMLSEVGASRLQIEYVKPVWHSSDATILPLDAPPDQSGYDPEAHGAKPLVAFTKPVHRAIYLIAHIDGASAPAPSTTPRPRPGAGRLRHGLGQVLPRPRRHP